MVTESKIITIIVIISLSLKCFRSYWCSARWSKNYNNTL